MGQSKILITGGYGCIGAETTKWFLRNTDASVVIGSRNVTITRTQQVFDDVDTERLDAVSVDISNSNEVTDLLNQGSFTHVIHLAALQTPDCNADRNLGLQVNLAGTQNIVEALKTLEIPVRRFVFASSIAVYGPRSSYPGSVVSSDAKPCPSGPYGIWKLAGEHLARLFFEETHIPTICLRPAVLYGPGRDLGLTSSPTTAMKHVVSGLPYEIPFCSRQDYQFAPDVGAATAMSAWEDFSGYGVYTLPSHTLTSQEVVDVIYRVAKDTLSISVPDILVGSEEVPFICDLECDDFLDQFPMVPHTPLAQGIVSTLSKFKSQFDQGDLIVSSSQEH